MSEVRCSICHERILMDHEPVEIPVDQVQATVPEHVDWPNESGEEGKAHSTCATKAATVVLRSFFHGTKRVPVPPGPPPGTTR